MPSACRFHPPWQVDTVEAGGAAGVSMMGRRKWGAMLGHLARRNRLHQGWHLPMRVERMAAALAAVAITAITAMPAHASGTAYAVETSEVGEDGGCKVESWVSWASNRDFTGTASPSCILPAMPIPTEAGLQITRSRAD